LILLNSFIRSLWEYGVFIYLKEECIVVLNHAQREAISEGTEHIEASI